MARWLLLLTLSRLSLAALLYNGLQSQILSSNLTESCDAAFNTSLNCPENVIQFITYPIQSVGWNTSTLETLCTSDCESSFADLYDAVEDGCGSDLVNIDNQNMTLGELVDLIQYKFGLICLTDEDTGEFCSDIEDSWNITEMVLLDEATWPTYTNKCYFDVSEGNWEYVTDVDGTCLDVFEFEFYNASNSAGITEMSALDYYRNASDPIDDDNYGWYDPLEFDEYPLEIQCSSCFLSRFKYGLENTWGDMWDEVTEQAWANMQLNCDLTDITITPANNFSTVNVDDVEYMNFTQWACPQTFDITGDLNFTCQEAAVYFQVPIGGIRNLNPVLYCPSLANITLCAPLTCPIGVVDLPQNTTIEIDSWVSQFDNITMTQFYTWNPYIGLSFVRGGDAVCVGPPGGVYVPPSATVAVPTVYTTTAIPESPVPSGTIANCGLYYLVQEGDDCDIICEAYGLTFSEFIDLNPEIDSACSNLLLGEDYCVAAVNGTYVSTVTTTRAPQTTSTSSSSTTSTKTTTTSTSSTVSYASPPSPTVSGTTPMCFEWYTVVSGDTCSAIDAEYGITLSDFIALNTYVDTACDNIWVGYSYCVDGIPIGSTTTIGPTLTTTSTSTGTVSTPTPTQSGMVSGCTTFYYAQSGDSCYDIAAEYDISLDDFYDWNPAVGDDCSGLWADYYYCVGI